MSSPGGWANLPLSLEQESFFGPDPVRPVNIGLIHQVDGALYIGTLREAISLVLARHEAPKSRLADAGQAGQWIAEPLLEGVVSWRRAARERLSPLALLHASRRAPAGSGRIQSSAGH